MRTEKRWGYEELIYNGQYCCKKLVYTRKVSSSLHYHERKHETFVVATGKFLLVSFPGGTRERTLNCGDVAVLTAGTRHRLRCIEPGFIVEASTRDDPEDCVRLIPSE